MPDLGGCICRQELVSGKSTPNADELEGYSGTTPGGAAKGVPQFWLNALCNCVSR